ncbi:MAG: hypothetical protein HOD85_21570 [Deltaproteobacteria bacterium]|nr:hypothetical protein [Deltaproteobacteria bacterium]
MKWIEIIELRSAGTSCNLLEVQLKEFMEQLANKSSKQMVKFYSRIMIDTSMSIHLYHNSSEVSHKGSSLGLKMASVLKSHGLVNHSIWIEKERII